MRGQGTRRHDIVTWLVASAALVLVVATIQLAAGGAPNTAVLDAAPVGASEVTAPATPATTAAGHDDHDPAAGDHDAAHAGATDGHAAGTHTDTTHPDDDHAGDHDAGTTDTTHGHGTNTAGTVVDHGHGGTSPTTHGHGGTTPTTHDHGGTTPTTNGSTPPTTHDHGGGETGGITAQTLAEIDVARQVAIKYPTAAHAEAAGWHKITVHLPGIAAHYLRGEYLDGTFDLSKPEVLLYGGDGLDAPLVGVNYIVRGTTPPAGFTGTADHWHEHPTLCFNPTLGLIVGDEHVTSAECTALGGNIISFAGNWLLHVWCIPGWEAPEGVFSHENSLVV